MDGGKVGRSMSTPPRGHGDERRETNSLPQDGAGPSREGAVDVHAQRPKSTRDQGTQTSEEREPATRPEVPSGSKNSGRDIPRNSPVAKISLQEFIPESQVVDYEEADTRRVRLSGFAKGVKAEDVEGLCAGAVETSPFVKGDNLTLYYASYGTAEEAVAAVRALNGVLVKGSPIKAMYLAERWHDPGTCPLLSSNILDIWNLPSEFCSKDKLEPVFKMGKVITVSETGSCKVEFPSSAELIKTVSDPSCHRLAGQSLKFAMAYEPVAASNLGNNKEGAAKRSKESAASGSSKTKSSGQNKKARKK
uniref:RNA-binding protein n=1 Tax=Rhipicephalus appendiculatus TaxID=34631 RepID=A0A131YJM5_RHIAP